MKPKIITPLMLANNLAKHPYAWPGGYPLYAVTDDGGCFCSKCCKSNLNREPELNRFADTIPGDGWFIVALDINWEDTELYCDNCGEKIEAAYR